MQFCGSGTWDAVLFGAMDPEYGIEINRDLGSEKRISQLTVADPDPGSGAFLSLDPGFEIRDPGWKSQYPISGYTSRICDTEKFPTYTVFNAKKV
jgi:hypothetical protein